MAMKSLLWDINIYSPSSYKTMSGSSQYRFGVLAKIVKHMKNRHCKSMKRLSFTKLITIPVSAAGDDHPLTIEEILDETNQLDIGSSVKNVIHHFT